MTLATTWTGRAVGTHYGNLYVQFKSGENPISGTLRFNESDRDIVLYDIVGKFNGVELSITGRCELPAFGTEMGELSARASIDSKGQLDGDWCTSTGGAGKFWLSPYTRTGGDIPEQPLPQLHVVRHQFGAIDLQRDDILEIADKVQLQFASGSVIITTVAKTEQSRFLEVFRYTRSADETAKVLKIFAQQSEGNGINRLLAIEFGQHYNSAMTQSSDETWTLGQMELLKRDISKYERSEIWYFRRVNVGAVQILIGWSIIYLPSLPNVSSRIIYMIGLALIIVAASRLHHRYLPLSIIYLRGRPPSRIGKFRAAAISWLLTVGAGIATAIMSIYLQRVLELVPVQ